MLSWLVSLPRKLYLYTGIVLTTIVALLTFGKINKNKGREEVIVEQILSDEEKRIKGREAAFKEKRDVDGVSDSDLIERLRRRRDDWGKL